eukprot:353426-Chlamydomonas_euryale.AAC.6
MLCGRRVFSVGVLLTLQAGTPPSLMCMRLALAKIRHSNSSQLVPTPAWLASKKTACHTLVYKFRYATPGMPHAGIQVRVCESHTYANQSSMPISKRTSLGDLGDACNHGPSPHLLSVVCRSMLFPRMAPEAGACSFRFRVRQQFMHQGITVRDAGSYNVRLQPHTHGNPKGKQPTHL